MDDQLSEDRRVGRRPYGLEKRGKRKVTTFTMSEEAHQMLKDKARVDGVPMSHIVERGIRAACGQEDVSETMAVRELMEKKGWPAPISRTYVRTGRAAYIDGRLFFDGEPV